MKQLRLSIINLTKPYHSYLILNKRISTLSPPLSFGLTGAILLLFRLKVGIGFHSIEARTVAVVSEVTVPYDQGAGVTLVKLLEQLSHRRLLLSRTRVDGLTAGIISALVADADRMGVVVQAMGADHPFRSSWLNCSVTTDHVVVADAFIMSVFAMPLINIFGRRSLVGSYCRTMNH